jgi:hypothetical protein
MCFTFVRKVRLYAVPQTHKHIQKKTISKEYTMLMNVGCLSEYDKVLHSVDALKSHAKEAKALVYALTEVPEGVLPQKLEEIKDVVQHMHETEEKLYSQLEKLEAKVQMKIR